VWRQRAQLSANFNTINGKLRPSTEKRFQYPIVFYAESDSLNNPKVPVEKSIRDAGNGDSAEYPIFGLTILNE